MRTELGFCGAVWITLPGLYEGVLAWDDAPAWGLDESARRHTVAIGGADGEVELDLPKGLRELPPPE